MGNPAACGSMLPWICNPAACNVLWICNPAPCNSMLPWIGNPPACNWPKIGNQAACNSMLPWIGNPAAWNCMLSSITVDCDDESMFLLQCDVLYSLLHLLFGLHYVHCFIGTLVCTVLSTAELHALYFTLYGVV